VKSICAKGHKIFLFSLSQKTTSWQEGVKGFEYKCFGVDSTTIKSNKRFGKSRYFNARKAAKEYFKEVQPDIVHAHYASSYGTLAKYIGFENTIVSLWGSDVYEFPNRSIVHKFIFQRAVKSAKMVCSTSTDMAREAGRWVKREYEITPFGVDVSHFIEGSKKKETLVLGTVKSLEEVYGIDRLIELYADFRKRYTKPNKLSIFGKGSQLEALKQLTKELEIEEHVSFEGYVSGNQLIEAFQSLDVALFLSRRESFGVAVLEAQACTVPSVVTHVGGLPEVTSLTDGKILSDNPEDWTLELEEFVGTLSSKKPRMFVVDNYSEDVCVDKLLKCYQKVLS
jgi:glycosyltransferase involved in cell wall biosynthesis